MRLPRILTLLPAVLLLSASCGLFNKSPSLTNPLLDDMDFHELTSFRSRIVSLISNETSRDMVDFIGVYFRSLNDGMWFGINENASFAPASLLKVPLMMTWYREEMKNRGLIRKKILYRRGALAGSVKMNIPDLQPLLDGVSYPAEELIKHMIRYSDNDAMVSLFENIPRDLFTRSFARLGIVMPEDLNNRDIGLSVKQYASLFRLLYNASWLDKKHSRKALEHLSKSVYRSGLVRGVPEDVIVAHKFGERSYQGSQQIQLHDCGIIYHESAPYILSVMTVGHDLNRQAVVIRRISELVWQEVSRQQIHPSETTPPYTE